MGMYSRQNIDYKSFKKVARFINSRFRKTYSTEYLMAPKLKITFFKAFLFRKKNFDMKILSDVFTGCTLIYSVLMVYIVEVFRQKFWSQMPSKPFTSFQYKQQGCRNT